MIALLHFLVLSLSVLPLCLPMASSFSLASGQVHTDWSRKGLFQSPSKLELHTRGSEGYGASIKNVVKSL